MISCNPVGIKQNILILPRQKAGLIEKQPSDMPKALSFADRNLINKNHLFRE
ncbi:hypothetical protein [Calothrix sp. NIES-3974]|uniref:hypothetical protein n=1 Tax=Calothrix sp. NIES-3974 TaxID=2005462 RepID=UPI000B5FF1CA|nr:hypothetical protein [Calothrix sp. NIES-3974]BAZ03572.1 hypothetical protein NIES3974_02010 [Calothrix sp. NIES-3974]